MVEQTSIEAYREIKPELGFRQRVVLNAIKELGLATNLMISRYLNIGVNTVTPRVFELREKKLVGVGKIEKCKISNRRAIYWKAV